jgi:hypothetical protein
MKLEVPKKSLISSDAELSWHHEYSGHIISASFLIRKNAKNSINSWFPHHFLGSWTATHLY